MSRSAPQRPSRFVVSSDGLRLHFLDYAPERDSPRGGARAPAVCLPGLARSAEDFDPIARRLTAQGRRVLALDYRGRGLSDWDPDWSHYDLDVEQDDILTVLAEAQVERAVFIGTSRGGLHTMRLARLRPGLVAAAVLNDIGPDIEAAGLVRIKRYVGRLPPLNSLADAVGLMRLTAGAHFSGVSVAEWEQYARQTFMEKDGKVALRYDPELSHTLDAVAPDMEAQSFWEEFDALAGAPVLAIRGANSDILSVETLAKMAGRRPDMEICVVEGQGHAPLLLDEPTLSRIERFADRCP